MGKERRSAPKNPICFKNFASLPTTLSPMLQFFTSVLSPEFVACIALLVIAKAAYEQRKDAGRKSVERKADSSTISVTSTAEYAIKTTTAKVHLAVRAEGETTLEVQSALSASSSRLQGYLRSQCVGKLQTTAISVRSISGKTVDSVAGYLGYNVVTFEVHSNRVASLVDQSVRSGATETNITFKAAPIAIAAAKKSAITAAVDKARADAEIAVAALGRTLGRATSVQIKDTFFSERGLPSLGFAEALMGAGQQHIILANVSASFEIV